MPANRAPAVRAEAPADGQATLPGPRLATRQDVAPLKQGVAVLETGLLMAKWIVSGAGFGAFVLVVLETLRTT